MGPLQIVLLVVGILVFVGAIQAAVWIPIIRKLRRLPGELRGELAAGGDKIERGPEACVYRGSDASDLPAVKGNGAIALTEKRIAIRRAIGKPIDVTVDRIVGVRTDKWFLRSYTGGRMHVIVQLRDGGEMGFFVSDTEGWVVALRRIAGTAAA